ncbi:fatty-acid amide hydrolase 2-A-like isoform X1 [Trichoplusia ni]|uniref:Fatty-acid amide hydrolase 2-A-like isoform X1 n=2 Tax=Trichoplusia ni TaxID=7111 RepID=A0A7E5WA80_TRINI|nr:fatty-acid amide hydrolase 2-A-like isoform X1 [Trichoplusia ni]XP_026737565.1 fatty-acid amide hydrolase 2-A-like isoform X1 [Trichoplusia ni]XP_026737566.1 fatty-acid amide hydrolase 2-A-like isoform X1 [Trichoplusia ni]XP_026737567.1 fatty-acid amide hydrolase 2-A-like isoform X1 [Trichoplusia ni]XP_026737568.1 fatty-acid amide hydrolase 2-A-like isoform X1 [Trichoplusia ni]XP_026737569.1 fatty-acid amide hydrolase 2-A-like isoform X1 [Trichoplusia ni]
MEVGVQLVGIILRLLNFLLGPIFWFYGRSNRRVPPVTNPILLKSACELAAAVRNGEITSEELVTVYINRVKEVNPYLNAVVDERYRAALDDARAVDREIEEAKKNNTFDQLVKDKPLLGVPFTVKESCSLIGLSNSVGCLENAGRRATADGKVVSLVKKAGAIPLLVSNTPELCLGWETTNMLRGRTNNPYCLSRTPGGSSGGEAALLASGASALSVASDIAGSIRLPAAFCGVFGHKPTPGIISIEGHIPTLSDENFPKFLTVGPMTRKAEDLPLLMNIMAGDNKGLLNLDEPVDLKKIKVHYMYKAADSIALLKVENCITEAIRKAVKYLETECGSTVSEEKFKDLEDSVEISVSAFFSMKDIPNLLQDPANPKRDKSLFVEFIKYFFGGGSRSLQGLSFSLINRSRLFIPDSRISYYNEKANALREQMQRVLGRSGVLLYPVCSGAAHAHHAVFTRAAGALYSMLFNIVGAPATAVPLPAHHGLPVALQVIAAPNQDRLCLAVAKQLEIGFGGWKPPQ